MPLIHLYFMKKIILASDAWHPQVSGVVRCVEEAKRYLEKEGFEVTLIHQGLFKGVPIFFYPEIKLSLFPKKKIQKIIEEVKPDYVHIFTEGPIGLATRSICVKKHLNFSTSYHTHFQYYIEQYTKIRVNFLFNLIDAYMRWFHNASNATMVITERFQEELGKRGYNHLKLWRLGVDTKLFSKNENSPIKERYHFPPPVFVYFGRVAKEKNVEEFLRLHLPGTKLVIGDGPARKSLEEKYGKEVVFLGYRKGQELVDFLSASNVFVFPSLTDTFPLAIIEAFSCGLPVAAHNVMGLNDLVVKGVGVLDNNLEKAATQCLQLSPEECREYALKFSWEESIKHFTQNLIKT